MTEMSYFRQQEIFRREQHQYAENHGRLAVVRANFSSQGQGTFEFDQMVDFGCTFIEQPWVSTGHQLDADVWREEMGRVGYSFDEDVSVPMPLSTGYVTAWEQDDSGYWVGAYVAVRVFLPDPEVGFTTVPATEAPPVYNSAMPAIGHVFRFEAVAIKSGGATPQS